MKLAAEKFPLRERLIFQFLYSTGCRRSELCYVDVGDIDLSSRTVLIYGKGRKERIVNYSPECEQTLRKYLKTHPTGEGALLLNSKGKRLGPESISQAIVKIAKNTKIDRSVTAHCLRHTFATNMQSKGVPMEDTRYMTGHASDQMLRKYIGIHSDDLREQYRKYK